MVITPTITVRIGESYITRDYRGELLETVELTENGTPDWDEAAICDHRGIGGPEAYESLNAAIDALELNAAQCGEDVVHLGE